MKCRLRRIDKDAFICVVHDKLVTVMGDFIPDGCEDQGKEVL